jgi:hypothetical protein
MSAVVVTGADRFPAFAGLALDIGLAGFALGIETVEVLFKTFLGGFARIDRAAP